MEITRQPATKSTVSIEKNRSYNDIVEYLDSHWTVTREQKSLAVVQELDKALGYPSQAVNTILIAGSNGKSLTGHFTTALLREEGLTVGNFYSPHILQYTERIIINDESIAQKNFCEVANEVIGTAEKAGIVAHTHELLTLIALCYFKAQKVDVALLEIHEGGQYDATNICHAKIATITRITSTQAFSSPEKLKAALEETMGIVKEGTWLVSGDQIKAHLQLMETMTKEQKGNWAMPIRKLAQLPYPFEQLHGRCAALAERIASMYVEKFVTYDATIVSDSLLSKPKGQRGRPTTEQKRHLELNPKKTIDQFWKEAHCSLQARFQLLEKEKPSILLDNASNVDAFENLLLGIRLLDYKKKLKGLTIIAAAAKDTLHCEEFLKAVRYFFKKTAGQIFICPLENSVPGTQEESSWNTEAVANDLKVMKTKARACKNFEEAFEAAHKSVDERNGLIVITGSQSIISTFWKHKGIKKIH
jgi:folylpolyglutamate synthase/dihydrofolate synthase